MRACVASTSAAVVPSSASAPRDTSPGREMRSSGLAGIIRPATAQLNAAVAPCTKFRCEPVPQTVGLRPFWIFFLARARGTVPMCSKKSYTSWWVRSETAFSPSRPPRALWSTKGLNARSRTSSVPGFFVLLMCFR